uniref:Uncharacterized protein n=1 Tax=Candidatus Kentrum sp. FW TaxID=2126338 RepID=A0A450U1V4_9GAMM|nr:MAG: hypothetical protein BECKFW1821C_GA0114237_110410 [Candidatus Kentron sp. FW]
MPHYVLTARDNNRACSSMPIPNPKGQELCIYRIHW